MAYSPAKIRIIGRTCMDEYNVAGGEQTIQEIVNAKNMTQENKDLVLAWIYTQRPELDPNYVPETEGSEEEPQE